MRRTMTALLLMVALTVTACAEPGDPGDGVASVNGTATPSASAAGEGEGDQLTFAQCMRENGMTWFEDPEPGARGLKIAVPPGTDKAKFEAAMKACRKHLPGGGEPGRLDPQAMERARQMSKCMRENGIPNFPDPGPDGGISIERGQLDVEPGDPAFDRAEKACARYAPGGEREEGTR